MIRAVIFDCFGVLTSEGWLPFKQRYFARDPDLLERADDIGRQLNAGLIGYRTFIDEIARLAQVPYAEALRAVQDNVPNDSLFDYIQLRLKPSYKLGILSNAGGNRLQELFTKQQLELFDSTGLSYATGYVKPDARAYRQAASGLGAEAGECVFIDDQERHCAGARAVGMQAICYRDFEQFRVELEKILAAGK